MVRYEYTAFRCFDVEGLNEALNAHGRSGWRLHTCEPVAVVGREGIGSIQYAVVMDRLVEDGEGGSSDEDPGAMPMRG